MLSLKELLDSTSMVACGIVEQLKELFERCATIEVLPHSFDVTLVDNLIDNIELDDPRIAEFVRASFSGVNFDSCASVVVSLLLRLYGKHCQSGSSSDEDVAHQLARSEVLLDQNRPSKVLSDLFTMYTSCYHFREQSDWRHVVCWSVTNLSSEILSIFVRRKIEDFLCLMKSDYAQAFVTSLLEMFCSTDSEHVLNSTARVLLHFADCVRETHVRRILEVVQISGLVGDVVYQLAATVRPSMSVEDELAPNKWNNETSRCQTIMKLFQTLPKQANISNYVASILLSPSLKLNYFVNVIDYLSEKELMSYLPIVCGILMDRRRAPLSDLQRMIEKLSIRLNTAELANVLDHIFPRLLECPSLMEALCKVKGVDCLDDLAMTDIKKRLALEITKAVSHPDWEVRDTVVEMAATIPCFRSLLGPLAPLVRFDPSPYVRSGALRCMILDPQYHHELPDLCESVVTLDVDAEPRLVAIRYLHSTLSENIINVFRILPKAIEDTDLEVRKLMVEMCSTLLTIEEYAEKTVEELHEWTEDAEIGEAVRAVLGEPSIERTDPVEHILVEMMNALHVHIEDTIDCY